MILNLIRLIIDPIFISNEYIIFHPSFAPIMTSWQFDHLKVWHFSHLEPPIIFNIMHKFSMFLVEAI